MKKSIGLDEKSYNTLLSIFEPYPYTFYIYGSRVKGNYRKYSDIDIFAPKEVPLSVISQLNEKCEESSLPYSVEITYEPRCSQDFINRIKNDFVPLIKKN